ncbi:MAG TPA: catalase [Thermomicrobiales bacterium]|nr:catalase [Thermomicrobiales bacterium]
MSQNKPVLTNRQGHPIHNNQEMRTVGNRGPATLENYHYIEKISHFDRERIPERVVHARGTVAHGVFEAYGMIGDEPASTYTRAKLFQEKGKQTPISIRFSTVAGGSGSSEVARDPRGFAVKFRTEDGNWDLVGNNLPIFFIRDATKFPDFIHSQKPDPVSNRENVAQRAFDFWAASPEAMHMLMWLFSPRGIPANYRQQDGFGVNTYRMVNAKGEGVLVKYHWKSQQGIESLTAAQAAEIQAKTLVSHTIDLYEAIERGDYPKWELFVQIMSDDEHPELDFDPLDDTKTWPEDQFPLLPVGMMTLNKNPENQFSENEQIAFGTGVLVDGLDFSDDKMLVGRTYSYSDTQRYRVGPNYLQLPINRPIVPVRTNQEGGAMSHGHDERGADPSVNYEPSYTAGMVEADDSYVTYEPVIETTKLTRAPIDRTNNYGQAGNHYRNMLTDEERDDLVLNFVTGLSQCTEDVQNAMLGHFEQIDADLASRVKDGVASMMTEEHAPDSTLV